MAEATPTKLVVEIGRPEFQAANASPLGLALSRVLPLDNGLLADLPTDCHVRVTVEVVQGKLEGE